MMILSSCHLWWSPEKQLSTWALASLWRLVLSLDTWWVYENSLPGACRYSSDQERDRICNENPEQPRGETGLNWKVHTNTSFLFSTSFAESRMMRYMRPYKMSGTLFLFCIHCGGPACIICNSGVSRIFTDFLKQVTRSPPAENLLTHYLHHPAEAPAHPAGEILAAGSYPTSKEIPGSSSQTILWNSKLSRFQSWNSK